VRGRPGATAPKLSSKERSEFEHPTPVRLVGNVQTTFREEFLDVATAQSEPDIKPNRVPDDRWRKLVTSERYGCHSPDYPSLKRTPIVCVTMPLRELECYFGWEIAGGYHDRMHRALEYITAAPPRPHR